MVYFYTPTYEVCGLYSFYAVEGAYCFGLVRLFVCASVQKIIVRVLKFYKWIPHPTRNVSSGHGCLPVAKFAYSR